MGGGFPALSSGVLLWEQQSLQVPTIMVAVPITVDAAGGATAIECAAGNKHYALAPIYLLAANAAAPLRNVMFSTEFEY